MSCRELVEIVTDYLEGKLTSGDRMRFEQHLGTCEACHIYLDQMRTTIRTLGRLTEESIPAEARDQWLRAFRSWRKTN